MALNKIWNIILVVVFCLTILAPVLVPVEAYAAKSTESTLADFITHDAEDKNVGDKDKLKNFAEKVFSYASMMLKGFLALMAIWKAGAIAVNTNNAQGLKEFAWVAAAFLVFFLLPYFYMLAHSLGSAMSSGASLN